MTVVREVQRIPTSGARAVEPLQVGDLDLLAVPQLAVDVPGRPADMNGGDGDTDLLLLRREGDRYEPWSTLPAPGGEDAEFFVVDGRPMLAVASIRSGSGPYDFRTASTIHTWSGTDFVPFQSIEGFAAKQWKHWTVDGRTFLGLAQGVQRPDQTEATRPSVVYEWDGAGFVEFQRIPSRWAYNWHAFDVDGTLLVAHADHLDPSVLYRWDGDRLVPVQELAARSGRAFATFVRDGAVHLLVACLQEPSRLMRWNGDRFDVVQELDGLGAREFAVTEHAGRLLVARINFVLGTPVAPRPSLWSQIYEWDPDAGSLRETARFPTTGATDAAFLAEPDGSLRLVVSHSLSGDDLRFASATVVYSVTTGDEQA